MIDPASNMCAATEEDGILQWLSAVNFSDKHERLRKDVLETNPKSGQWFLASARFAQWKFFPQSLLWLYGECERLSSPFRLIQARVLMVVW